MNKDTSTQAIEDNTNHVVVLGSGYAGIHACRQLISQQQDADRLQITLISDVDHLLYTTMIYEVPAGNLAPSSIRQSVRTLFSGQNVHFKKGKAVKINTEDQIVRYQTAGRQSAEDDSGECLDVDYDYLVSAIGSETQFFGTPGAEEHTHQLKNLKQAKDLKNRLVSKFEQASLETDTEKIQQLLSFVVVGGGPTGVTLSAKLANLLNHELAESFPELVGHAQIHVLEAQDAVVKRAGLWFSNRVGQTLESMERVSVKTGCRVDKVESDRVLFNDEEEIKSECVVWTAGVKAREITFADEEAINKDEHSRRIHVTPKLHMPEDTCVYVAGDQAWVERIDSDQPYPMRAQFAVRQGAHVAENILADIRSETKQDFYWNDKGIVISVGHGHTYAEVFGIKMSGFFATIAYKSIYLMSTIGFRAKARAALEWFMNLFLPRDISEL
jgi:NADH dehydrogenase